jgi:hypothetical protein
MWPRRGREAGVGTANSVVAPVVLSVRPKALIAVEHAQPVCHILERRIEQRIRLFQRRFGRCELQLAPHANRDREEHSGRQE